MLAKIKEFVEPDSKTLTRSAKNGTNLSKVLSRFYYLTKKHQADIVLIIGVILISLFSFAMGYIVAKQQEKEPIKIEKITSTKGGSESSALLLLKHQIPDNIQVPMTKILI